MMSGLPSKALLERSPSCRWCSTPSPCSRLLSHDLTHVRPPLRLSFTLISGAMGCTGANRHLGRPSTLSQSLNRLLANEGKNTGTGKSGKQAQTNMGRITGSDVRPARGFAPRFAYSCVAHFPSTEDRCWHGNGDDDGREERETERKIGDGGEAPRRSRPARRTVAP